MKTYYQFFGLKENASDKEINFAYNEMISRYKSNFKLVSYLNEIYSTLVDSNKRKIYDVFLENQKKGNANNSPQKIKSSSLEIRAVTKIRSPKCKIQQAKTEIRNSNIKIKSSNYKIG